MSTTYPVLDDLAVVDVISPRDEIARCLSTELARHMDAVVRDVLDRHLGPGWTMAELAGRCTAAEELRTDRERRSVTYLLDGKPLVRFYPATFSQPIVDHAATMHLALEYEVFL